MALKLTELRGRAVGIARRPRTRKIAIWVAAIVAFILIVAAAGPPLLRTKIASELSAKLHRPVSIEAIWFNPFTMSLTVRGFLVKERQGSATAVSFDELYANLELKSLFRWAPVFKELRLTKPYVSLIRNEDHTYNFTDLIEEFTKNPPKSAPQGPPEPTPRFALNNIQILDGKIDFDDRPEQTKHTISAIKIGVPFISSIPSDVKIEVRPELHALVNGAPLEIDGETRPFLDSLDSTIHLDFDDLQIPKYVEYSPVELNFKVPSGQLDTKLTVVFRTKADKPAVLSISGNVGVKELRLQEKTDAPLLNLPALDVFIDAVEIFAQKASLKSVKLQSPELHVTRNHDGALNLTSLIAENKTATAAEQKKPDEKPFGYQVDEILVDQGKLFFTDQSPEQPFGKQLQNIHVDVKGLTNEPEKKATAEISFQSDAKEEVNYDGTLQLTPLASDGKIEVKSLQLKGLRPYYESVVGVDVTEGLLDLTTRFAILETDNKQPETKLGELNASLRSLRLNVPNEREPLWRSPLLAIKDATVDVDKKSIVVGSVESSDGNGFIQRNPDGSINFARIVKTQAGETEAKKPEQEETAEWAVQIKRMAFDRFRLVFEDGMLSTPARTTVSALSARAENISNAKNARAKVRIQATINNKGRLILAGALGTRPVAGRLNVEAQNIEVVPFQPYFADEVNLLLTSGAVSSKGVLAVDMSTEGAAKVNYEGGVQVADFASVEKDASQDLLKWKSLDLGGIQFALEPMRLRINEITLADFYARLILGADGKLNLQSLTVQKDSTSEPVETKAAKPAEPVATAPASENPISIGKINLRGGNVYFSDFFVKPNYSANLTGVDGSISELKPDTPGDIAIQAKLDNESPVDIQGKINPLSKDLYLDIAADAREIALNPMSPYSIKYIGYGIERGELSFKVKYKVENRKLDAQNQIILDQLTFGDKVESPTATKLPVLLAVALLKDRNGVIDVNVPISGSLDNPEFSVGGIILRIIFNLITRAVTSPFALIGSAFGGGSGEQLSYIEFDYGRSNLTESAEAKIKTIATAMANRPALKLDISGRVDPVNDREGLKQTSIERKVKAEKMKELIRQGKAPKSVDDVQVDQAEYERYLRAAYDDESFPKPRNFIGFAKELPVPEMESLMLKYAQVTDDDLRNLANRRAQVVRDRLIADAQISADRLSIIAAKPLSAEEKEKTKAKLSRVDFALR
ncbi:MAG TPA: DUF748 domain-containing protein [Candidatus Binatia bacterium]|jgi:uncharacterized protein involved in outer membrane biogenesis